MPKPGPRLRLVDVAERAGVSLATASRALAGRDGVSEEVADRVRQVSRELGYVANPYARTLAGGASPPSGLVVHQVDDPYFSEIAGGVIQVADEQSLLVQICHSGRDPRARAAPDPAPDRPAGRHHHRGRLRLQRPAARGRGQGRADGVPGPRRPGRGDRPALAWAWTPCCPTTRPAAGRSASTCSSSATGGSPSPPAPSGLTTVADRLAGVAAALHAVGLSLDDLPVVHTDFTRDGGRAAASGSCATTRRRPRSSRSTTRWRSACCPRCGRAASPCPDQMSVVGFDDVSVAADLAPSLTTVRLPMTDMGRMALDLALKPRSARPRRRSTGHELIVRDSTAAP